MQPGKREGKAEPLFIRYSTTETPVNYDYDSDSDVDMDMEVNLDDFSNFMGIDCRATSPKIPAVQRQKVRISRGDLIVTIPEDQGNTATRSQYNADRSPLLRLPPEIRLSIWRLCLERLCSCAAVFIYHESCTCMQRGSLPILYVCRHIRTEVLPLEFNAAMNRRGHVDFDLHCTRAEFIRLESNDHGDSAIFFVGYGSDGDVVGFAMKPITTGDELEWYMGGVPVWMAVDQVGEVHYSSTAREADEHENWRRNLEFSMASSIDSFVLGRGRAGMTVPLLQNLLNGASRMDGDYQEWMA